MKSDNDKPEVHPPIAQAADYSHKQLPDDAGNPFIEALPSILPRRQFFERTACKPKITEDQRRQEPEWRIHQLDVHLEQLFLPLNRHFTLHQGISKMLRSGYRKRNPMGVNYDRLIEGKTQSLGRALDSGVELPMTPTASVESGLLTGISGTGKSTSVERVLRTFPQVIKHDKYGDRPFPQTQVVWMHLQCPYNSGPYGVCTQFFKGMDQLLGTNYEAQQVKQHSTTNRMLTAVGSLALTHGLGLLVVDEIQNLNEVKSGGDKQMLNFIVQIVNTLGVPVLLVGNSNVLFVLGRALRLFRRSVGSFADPHWFRFVEGDPEWNLFTKHLWDLQLVKKPVPLGAAVSTTLYRYSQGIPDLLVKLFNSAQQFAMNEGVEELSPELLEQVARKELMAGNLRLIEAIRKQDYNKLGQIEDVHPLDVIDPRLSDDLRAAAETEILKSRDLEYRKRHARHCIKAHAA